MKNGKGFTLAELLIVVAIIAVLVAISIPIFASQLEKSRESTDATNIRSQYAEVMVEAISTGTDVNLDGNQFTKIDLKQKVENYQDVQLEKNLHSIASIVDGEPSVKNHPVSGGKAWVSYSVKNNVVSIHYTDGNVGESGIFDAIYNVNKYNNSTVNTYLGWNKESEGIDKDSNGNKMSTSTATFAKAVMSAANVWLTNCLRDKLNDSTVSVKVKNLGSGNIRESLDKAFNQTGGDKSFDKILTVSGEKGTYEYYYKKNGGNSVKLVAVRHVTPNMYDKKGNIIYNITEDDRDGWVAYID